MLSVLIPIQIWDCPANYPIENLPILLGAFSTIIYVIDIQVHSSSSSRGPLPNLQRCVPQDDYGVPIHLLLQLMAQIYVETEDQARKINLEVFVHKADGMSDDYKLG
jgi:Ras-related GTP-binding protein C/D